MLFGGLNLSEILFRIPAVLLAISFHECAHGFIAYKLGDPTAKQSGRLSLNPMAHMDLLGAVSMLLVGFGWARPVPVNPLYFKNPKQGMSLVGLAGPVSNFLMALIFSFLYGLGLRLGLFVTSGISTLSSFTEGFLVTAIQLNVGLGIFNLIPFPPLDGSKILAAVLPDRIYYKLMQYERFAMPILFILLLTNVLSIPLSFVSVRVYNLLLKFIIWVAGIAV